MIKIIGYDDSVHSCDCCGKTNLKSTVLVMVDGVLKNYGSVCATRNTGLSESHIKGIIVHDFFERQMNANADFVATPEYLAEKNKRAKAYQLSLVGKPFRDYCRAEQDALNTVRQTIAAQYSLKPYDITL